MNWLLRTESSKDCPAIAALIQVVFEASQYDHHGEVCLSTSVSGSAIARLSLVAEVEERIVGHALFTQAMLKSTGC